MMELNQDPLQLHSSNLMMLMFLMLMFLILIMIYRSLIPIPISGIPILQSTVSPLGDFGLIYKFKSVGFRTQTLYQLSQLHSNSNLVQVMLGPVGSWLHSSLGIGKRWVIVNDPTLVIEICQKRSNEFPDPGLGLEV